MNCHHYPICARNLVVRLYGIHEVVSTNKRVLSLYPFTETILRTDYNFAQAMGGNGKQFEITQTC